MKCIEDEIPFELPDGWTWARLGALAHYKKGPFGSSITKAMFVPESKDAIKVYEQKNAINKNDTLGNYFITKEKYEELKGFEVFPGDIIVSCAGTIGETFVMPNSMRKGIINQALMKISLYDSSIKDFYLIYFDCKLKALANEQGYGMALKNIPPFDILKQYLVPLPPLPEQRRIIDKINIVSNVLTAIDNHIDKLSIDISNVKSKILDLAIRGKLVPQDPNDEPASVLLERIRAEKEELIKQGKIKRDKKESVIFKGDDNSYYRLTSDNKRYDVSAPFDLPDCWEWTTFPTVAHVELGKTLDKVKNTGTYYPYLRSVNVQWGYVDLSDVKEMKFEPEEIERYTIKKNDLLICEGGDVGRCCVWNKNESILYQNAIHRVRFYNSINCNFYMYFMMYLEAKGTLKRISNGVTIKHLTNTVLTNITIPLPPLAEQERIVNAVETLFAQIDKISEQIL